MDNLSNLLNAPLTSTTVSVLVALVVITWIGGGVVMELSSRRPHSEVPPDHQLS